MESEELLVRRGTRRDGEPESLSLEWSIASDDEEFERGLDEASIEGLSALSYELDEEEIRLRRIYEQAKREEQRHPIKAMIRRVAASSGSVEASIIAHPNKEATQDDTVPPGKD